MQALHREEHRARKGPLQPLILVILERGVERGTLDQENWVRGLRTNQLQLIFFRNAKIVKTF